MNTQPYRTTLLENQRVRGSLNDYYHRVLDVVNSRRFKRGATATALAIASLAALVAADVPRKATNLWKSSGPSLDDVSEYIPPEISSVYEMKPGDTLAGLSGGDPHIQKFLELYNGFTGQAQLKAGDIIRYPTFLKLHHRK